MIELDPMSGRIRFWYGGVRFGHLQLNAPIQAQALRIQGKHNGNVLADHAHWHFQLQNRVGLAIAIA